MLIELVRHAPKNNFVDHGDGTTATVDESKLQQLYDFVQEREQALKDGNWTAMHIEHTPVGRAAVTAQIAYDRLSVPEGMEKTLSLNALVGSYAVHPQTGQAVNLSPQAMSDLWAQAKKQDNYTSDKQKESAPLRSWLEQGLYNPQANNNEDPGIALMGIAWRISAGLHQKLEHGNHNDRYLCIGHSGDIEPWLIATVIKKEMTDFFDTSRVLELYDQMGGALEPLTGVQVEYSGGNNVLLTGVGLENAPLLAEPLVVSRMDLFQQAQSAHRTGLGYDVLTQKANLAPQYKP